MGKIALASGAYSAPSLGLPDRLCENAYLERSRTTPDGEVQIMPRPGTLALPDWASAARGYEELSLGGVVKVLAVVGSAIKTYDPATGTVGTITGSIAGTDRVVIKYTEQQIGILGGGIFHVGDLTGIAAVTDPDFAALLADHDQTAFINLMSIGQRFVLQYGSRFCFTAVNDGDNTTALNYYTAEYAPDGLVGGSTIGLRMWHMGGKTGEPWEETGQSDDPYRRSLGQELDVGLRARDCFKNLDGVPYWIDQHNQVRRSGNAAIPDNISGPDVSLIIGATDVEDLVAFTLEFEGHAFYGIHMPTMCPLYDANYGEWTRFLTLQEETWRYGFALRVSGKLFVGDMDGTGFALMHPDYRSDHMPDASTMGTERVWRVSGYILTERVRPMGKLRYEGSKGIGLATGQGSDPQITMRRSLKGPKQFSSSRSRSVGVQGRYDKEVSWQQNGDIYPPGCAIEVSGSDPVPYVTTGLYEDV